MRPDGVQVLARLVRAPEMVLEPEGRLGEGVVLGRTGLEPYGAEPGEGSQQPIIGYPGLVVPDEAAAEDRKIGNRGDNTIAARPTKRCRRAGSEAAVTAATGSAPVRNRIALPVLRMAGI